VATSAHILAERECCKVKIGHIPWQPDLTTGCNLLNSLLERCDFTCKLPPHQLISAVAQGKKRRADA